MVTSAVPGEGKTYTAVNLALSMAQERDTTVLLVDCDVTKQGVSRMLGVEKRRPDFIDLLASDSMSIGDVLVKTDVPGLVMLPAGRPHEYITEMVASKRMQSVMEEFATRYNDRIVIFDAPPMLSTPGVAGTGRAGRASCLRGRGRQDTVYDCSGCSGNDTQ